MPGLSVLSSNRRSPLEILVDDYLTACKARGLARSTVANSYGYPLRSIFLPWCADQGIREVEDLTPRAIDAFSIYLLDDGGKRGRLSKHSVHAYCRSVPGFLTWCNREGEAVTAQPQLPRLPRKVVDILDRGEIDALEGAVSSERDKIIVRILGDCGLRAGELCSLRLEDVIRRDRNTFLHVRGKGARERLVPVVLPLFRRIERYARTGRPSDLVTDRLFVSHRRGRSGFYERLTPNTIA
jgi:integrase